MASERERERHGWVEVCAADVANRIDAEHDHQAGGERNADVAKLVRLCIDHDSTTTGESSANVPMASAASVRTNS
jgi:hypothetical protein